MANPCSRAGACHCPHLARSGTAFWGLVSVGGLKNLFCCPPIAFFVCFCLHLFFFFFSRLFSRMETSHDKLGDFAVFGKGGEMSYVVLVVVVLVVG
jgi:hypothetical protein